MRKIATILLLILVSAGNYSCNKYLDLKPNDGIIRDIFWQSKEQLQAATLGCYNAMEDVPSGKTPAELFFVWGELRADMISPGLGMGAEELSFVNYNILSTNTFADWRNIYRVINICNTVIDFGPNVKNIDATLSTAELNGYLAEALTVRAMMYFYLVRTFGDVPMKIKATATDADITNIAKTPKADVLKQIVADLKLAEGYAVETYNNNTFDKGRVTKYTVYAVEADVYLWLDDYANCIAAADKIINSNKFALVPGNSAWFNTVFGNGNSVEGIFELQFDQQILNPYYAMFTTSKRRYIAANNVLSDIYTIDPQKAENIDIRGIDAAVRPSDQSIYKYLGLSDDVARTQDGSYAHWIFYRYADILLLKAEACINSGRGQDALDIISQIRQRGHALSFSEESPLPDDVAGLTDYLVKERAREFAYEGKRWYDLLRNAKRNNYARMDILREAVLNSVPPSVQQSALNKLKDPNSHYLPIFYTEIQNDPLLIQNPFYK